MAVFAEAVSLGAGDGPASTPSPASRTTAAERAEALQQILDNAATSRARSTKAADGEAAPETRSEVSADV